MRPRYALSLSLVRYCRIHCVGRGCAPFSSAHSFGIPSGEGGGDDGVEVLRSVSRPVMRSVFSFRLTPFRASSIRAVASRRRRSHLSRLPACLVPRLVKSSARCLVAHSVSFLVPPFVSPCVSSYLVSLSVSFSCRFPSCRIAARLSPRRFVQLVSSFFPMPCRSHRLMTG